MQCFYGPWIRDVVLFWPLDPVCSSFLAPGSGIQCFSGPWIRDAVLFWPLDPGCSAFLAPESWIRDPRSGINISSHISDSLETIVWVKKTLKLFTIRCCGSGIEKSRSGMEKPRSGIKHPGSATHHFCTVLISSSKRADVNLENYRLYIKFPICFVISISYYRGKFNTKHVERYGS
jgi:hypothetical protein